MPTQLSETLLNAAESAVNAGKAVDNWKNTGRPVALAGMIEALLLLQMRLDDMHYRGIHRTRSVVMFDPTGRVMVSLDGAPFPSHLGVAIRRLCTHAGSLEQLNAN